MGPFEVHVWWLCVDVDWTPSGYSSIADCVDYAVLLSCKALRLSPIHLGTRTLLRENDPCFACVRSGSDSNSGLVVLLSNIPRRQQNPLRTTGEQGNSHDSDWPITRMNRQ